MDTSILKKAGLSENQAKAYLCLLEQGTQTPTQLGSHIGESRENTYAIASKLMALGLAARGDEKKITYKANHPSALETLSERRRKIVTRNELEVKQHISGFIDMFYALNEQPGVRTLQGQDGLMEVFNDIIRTAKDIHFIRADAKYPTLPREEFQKYRDKRNKIGLHTYALVPPSDREKSNESEGINEKYNIHPVFYPSNAYTLPVEIDVYGDKVAFLAFGETQMATIINSPPIANAMREMFQMLRVGYEDYSNTIKRGLQK